MYRIFDGAVKCDFQLSGLPEVREAEADIRVKLEAGAVDESGYEWFHSWRETDGEVMLACARRAGECESVEYLLRFPGLADFVISGDLIKCHPKPDCPEISLRHLVLDQVIPRLWAHWGNLVLHASAVKLRDGRVVAFIGESGWGKSTLAAALQARGSQLLSDDSVSLKPREEGVQIIPSYTGLRLLDDSISTLGLGAQDWANVSHYSDKRRLASAIPGQSSHLWLDTLYVMQEPRERQVLSIEAVQGTEVFTTLIKRSFLLDINDRHCAVQQINEAGAVLRAVSDLKSLGYPREFEQLPRLCDALERNIPI